MSQSETWNLFPFNNKVLIAAAPDDPSAPKNSQDPNQTLWRFSLMSSGDPAQRQRLAYRAARATATADEMFYSVRHMLHLAISSNEVDQLSSELHEWITQRHADYQGRSTQTLAHEDLNMQDPGAD